MPRRSRIDAPGALHHVIVRGIARKKIFFDDTDRDRFVERLGVVLVANGIQCFAWALIPNHFHLLLKTNETPLSTSMRRLLTGYAVNFNRRHRRWGHVFQNRYKSILCEEETYLLGLTRYIHLNPLRAKLVDDLKALDAFPYCGHGVVMGKVKNDWQNTAEVLRRFGDNTAAARKQYRHFVKKGIAEGRRPDLTGGGLVRSHGGWTGIKAMKKEGVRAKGDERILGQTEFVLDTLRQRDEWLERKHQVRTQGYDVDTIAQRVADLLAISSEDFLSPGKQRQTVKARSLLCFWAARDCGITMSALSLRLGICPAAVSQSVARGQKVAADNGYRLSERPDPQPGRAGTTSKIRSTKFKTNSNDQK